MKALYITNKPIYPIVDGGCFAMDAFLRSLLTFSEVKNLSVSTSKHPFALENYPEDIAKKTNPEGQFINTKTNPFGFVKAVMQRKSYNVSRFYDKTFSLKIKKLIHKTNFDVIIVESAFLLIYQEEIKTYFKGKIILRAPNVEYKIWEDYATFCTNTLKKSLFRYLAKSLKKFELNALQKVDLILSITENDKLQLQSEGIQQPIEVVPFSIEQQPNLKAQLSITDIFFLGAYNWKPNYDAAQFLIREILPEITQEFPNIKLHLAGSYLPESWKKYASKNCLIHGKVVSSLDFCSNHGILVAPIFSGSGVRIKILEALSIGVPVIASTIAMQGIPSNTVSLADNKSEFIAQLKKLILSENERVTLQQNALETIDKLFNPTTIAQQLKSILHAN